VAHNEPVPRDVFDKLVARALEIDRDAADALTAERARETALEAGVSAPAWDAAVMEYTRGSLTVRRLAPLSRVRTSALALGGFGVGFLSGVMDWGGPPFAVCAIAASALIAVVGARNRAPRVTDVELAAWWSPMPFGIMLGAGAFLTDPLWFAGVSLAASIGFARAIRLLFAPPRRVPGAQAAEPGEPLGHDTPRR